MAEILTTADYAVVRSLLGDVDSALLSDELIASAPFLQLTEIVVKRAVPGWAAIKAEAGDDWTLVQVAAEYMLAYALAQFLSRHEVYGKGGWSVGGYSESLAGIDFATVLPELRRQAALAFSLLSTNPPTTRPAAMIASGPSSARANTPVSWEQWVERVVPRILDWLAEGGGEDDPWVS